MEEHSDRYIINGILENDIRIMHSIYQTYSSKIQRFILQNSGTIEDAEDMFQECLLVIHRKAQDENFRLYASFEAYLRGVCYYIWLKELEKRRQQRVTNIAFEELSDEIPINEMDIADTSPPLREQALTQALTQLPPECRRVLDASWDTKTPLIEIAKTLGYTYGYLRKRKAECMAKLIQLIKKIPPH